MFNLITQYYLSHSKKRQAELDLCLEKNLANPHLETLHLLNEKPYTLDRLRHKKIHQHIIGHRLNYHDAFRYANSFLPGKLCILSNADIFFDASIAQCSHLTFENHLFALLRYEYDSRSTPYLFGPRNDSQDSWIFSPPIRTSLNFDFPLGQPGCDNKLIYLLKQINYAVFNPCHSIKSFHLHQSAIRTNAKYIKKFLFWKTNNTKLKLVPPPYAYLDPCHLDDIAHSIT